MKKRPGLMVTLLSDSATDSTAIAAVPATPAAASAPSNPSAAATAAGHGHPPQRRAVTSLPLRDASVLRLSVAFFNDPEPCMIHRSAVMNRMYMELTEHLQQLLHGGVTRLKAADLPEPLAGYLELDGRQTLELSIDG